MAWVVGIMYLLLGLLQVGLALLVGALAASGTTSLLVSVTLVLWVSGPLTLVQAAIFLAMAAKTTAVRRAPVPHSAPVIVDAVRPLPDEQEGPTAGWYSVAPRFTRWWTGERWSQYVGTPLGVRPTFTAVRTLRILIGMGCTFVGVAILGFIVGAALLIGGTVAGDDLLMAVIGGVILFGGVLFGVLGTVCLVMSRLHRRTYIPPQYGPTTASAQNLDQQNPGVQY